MNKASKIILAFLQSTIFLYVIAFAVLYQNFNYQQIRSRTLLLILDRLRPESLKDLIEFSKSPQQGNKKKLLPFEFYYGKAYEYKPEHSDALGVLAYCSYYLGKKEKAVKSYQTALAANPEFFWFYYNLGLIYYKEGKHAEAAALLSKGIKLNPKLTKIIIKTSFRVYLPISTYKSNDHWDSQINEQLIQGYKNAYLVLIKIFEQKKDYEQMLMMAQLAVSQKLDADGIFSYYAGLASFHLKNYQSSLQLIKESVAKNIQYSEYFFALSDILKILGYPDKAVPYLNQAEYLKAQGKNLPQPENFNLEVY